MTVSIADHAGTKEKESKYMIKMTIPMTKANALLSLTTRTPEQSDVKEEPSAKLWEMPGHCRHSPYVEYVPCAHFEHSGSPPLEYFPGGQRVHKADPATE